MESRTLSRQVGEVLLFWEVTWEGCAVEVARWSGADEPEAVTLSFATPTEAGEHVEEQVARLLVEGWAERREPAEERAEPCAAVNPALEEALRRDPEDLEARLVYADWLQARGDPRGQLIVLQHALAEAPTPELEQAERDLRARQAEHLLGALGEAPELAELDWRLGFVREARLFVLGPGERGFDDVEILRSFLDNPSMGLVERLLLHAAGRDQWRSSGLTEYAEALRRAGPRPLLTSLQLGLPGSWARLRCAGGLWSLTPRLRELALCGSIGQLGALELPALRRLALDKLTEPQALTDLALLRCPALEHLSLGLASLPQRVPRQVEGLFDGLRLPALRQLALDGQGSVEALVLPLLTSRVFSGLETLELHGGFTLPEALASLGANGRLLARLPTLVLGGWNLDAARVDQLRAILPQVVVRRAAFLDELRYDVEEGLEDEEDEDGLDEYERRKYGEQDGVYDDREFQIYAYAEQAASDSWDGPIDDEDDPGDEAEEARDLGDVWDDPTKEDPFDLDDE